MRQLSRRAALGVLAVGALAGCTAEQPSPTSTPAAETPTPTPTPASTRAPDAVDRMTPEQRAAQLFMVGTDATRAEGPALDAVATHGVGGVFLAGRSAGGVAATAAVVAALTAAAGELPLLVATDQEGGLVQVLRGPGFSEMPSAVLQSGLGPAALREAARGWGAELAACGVNLNLAPVADIVPDPAHNPPIGGYRRQYGADAASVAANAAAFSAGMLESGVRGVAKHFPGLGYVTDNTDTVANVVDSRLGPDDPNIAVFRSLVRASTRFVMMSSARYPLLDPVTIAAFSRRIVTGILRETMGFGGVIMTDDVGAATATQAWAPADRAVLAIAAGCDLVLVARAAQLVPEMIAGVVARAAGDETFAARVDESARRIVGIRGALAR